MKITILSLLFVILCSSAVLGANVQLALDAIENHNELEYAVLLKNNIPVAHVEPDDSGLSLQFELSSHDVPTAIRINGLNAQDIKWTSQSTLRIDTPDSTPQSIAGKDVIAALDVAGMDQFITKQDYNPFVAFYITEREPVDVLWCDDECHELPPCFTSSTQCYTHIHSVVSVYIPHFSQVFVTTSTATPEILMPANGSTSTTGENLSLLSRVAGEANITATLDGTPLVITASFNGTSTTTTAALTGLLAQGIISNGVHTVVVNSSSGNESASATSSFTVSDSSAPVISEENGVANSSRVTNNFTTTLKLNSSEFSIVFLSVNGGAESNITLFKSVSTPMPVTGQVGNNTITIRGRDVHGNEASRTIRFEIIHEGTCSDGVRNGHETGVDCGGPCGSCTPFLVSTDKPKYNTSDQVRMTVQARANATVEIIVQRGATRVHNETILPYSPGFPIFYSTIIPNTGVPGNYTIQGTSYYLSTSEQATVPFEVLSSVPTNPLSVSISMNDTQPDEGESVSLVSSVSGAPSGITYAWDVGADGSIDSTASGFVFLVNRNGTIPVNLTVTSGGFNKTASATIIAHRRFNVTFILKNISDLPIPNATISLDNDDVTTDSAGRASILVRSGTFDIDIVHPRYNDVSFESAIHANGTFSFTLNSSSLDLDPPAVSVLSPANNSQSSDSNLTVRFAVLDQSNVSCFLSTSVDGSFFLQVNRHPSPRNVETQITGPATGTVFWTLGCTDALGRTTTTGIFRHVKTDNPGAATVSSGDSVAEDTIRLIDEALPFISSWSAEQKQVATEIDFEKLLQNARKQALQINRDIHNLRFRKVSDEEREVLRDELLASLEKLKESTIVDFELEESYEFVNYPAEDTVASVLSSYLTYQAKTASEAEEDFLVQILMSIQNELVATTRAYTLHTKMLSGENKDVTLIVKSLKITRGELLANQTLLEFIPKEMAATVNDTRILNFFKVVDADPIVEIPDSKTKKIMYFVDGFIAEEQIRGATTLLAPKELVVVPVPRATGFSVFPLVGRMFGSTDSSTFAIQLGIIIVLIPVALFYALRKPRLQPDKQPYKAVHREVSTTFTDFTATVAESHTALRTGNSETAKELYQHLRNLYRVLPPSSKADALAQIHDVKAHLDAHFLKRQLMKAEFMLEEGHKAKAREMYRHVCSLYKQLPPQHKKEVHSACSVLYSKLH